MYSVEVDNSNPTALGYCLKRLEKEVPDFYDWKISINAGSIDYGVYLNIDIEDKSLEISNQPRWDDAYLDDIIDELNNNED